VKLHHSGGENAAESPGRGDFPATLRHSGEKGYIEKARIMFVVANLKSM